MNPYVVYAIVTVTVLTGLYFCIAGRGSVFLFGDEFHSVWNLDKPYGELVRLYDIYGTGVPFQLSQRLSVDIFGPGLWAYRFPAMLGAILSVLIVYPVARRCVGQVPALIASPALVMNSMHIFYSRFGRAYSLTVFFGLLLVYALSRTTGSEKRRWFWYVVTGVCVTLLGWLHLTTVVFVAAVGIAQAIAMLIRKQSKGDWCRLVGSFAVGAVICVLLYLPAWDGLRAFLGLKYGQGVFGKSTILAVFSLLAGSYAAGWVFLLGVAGAAVWILKKQGAGALVLIAAATAPIAGLLISRPAGNVYAYARYLLIGLGFMLMLLAWLVVELFGLLRVSGKLGGYLAPAAGVVLVGLAFATGPLGRKHTDAKPFANTYLSMMPLPAFDVAWDETPGFYRKLAASSDLVRIIEAPELLSDSVLLYRNYYLQHGKEVRTGLVKRFVDAEKVHLPAGPYVDLSQPGWADRCEADYLVLHRNVLEEIIAYWQFVYNEVWPTMRDADIRAFMAKHYTVVRPVGSLEELVGHFRKQLGEPVYEDSRIVVWKLRQ